MSVPPAVFSDEYYVHRERSPSLLLHNHQSSILHIRSIINIYLSLETLSMTSLKLSMLRHATKRWRYTNAYLLILSLTLLPMFLLTPDGHVVQAAPIHIEVQDNTEQDTHESPHTQTIASCLYDRVGDILTLGSWGWMTNQILKRYRKDLIKTFTKILNKYKQPIDQLQSNIKRLEEGAQKVQADLSRAIDAARNASTEAERTEAIEQLEQAAEDISKALVEGGGKIGSGVGDFEAFLAEVKAFPAVKGLASLIVRAGPIVWITVATAILFIVVPLLLCIASTVAETLTDILIASGTDPGDVPSTETAETLQARERDESWNEDALAFDNTGTDDQFLAWLLPNGSDAQFTDSMLSG